MPKFSIITPSYNSWQYMETYWKSLEGQTFTDFEVVVVDDCSVDDTYEKLNAYVAKSPLNIKLLSNSENHGPGYSRNRGMAEAVGDWITFVDSDDSVDIHLLEKADSVIKSNDRAAVPINCIVYDYNIVKGNEVSQASSMYGNCRGGIHSVSTCIAMVRNHVIGKFYKAEKVKKISFPELKRCEDIAFVCRAIEACCMEGEKVIGCTYYLKDALYNYNQRPGSLSNDSSLDVTDMIKAYGIIKENLGAKYPKEIEAKAIPDLLYGGVLIKCKANKDNQEIKSYIDNFEKQYPRWYENYIVKELGKAKLIFLACIKHRSIRLLKSLAKVHSKLIG